MTIGQGGAKDGVFTLAPHGFVLPHPYSAPHNMENFVTPSPPLGPHEALTYLVKLYFLLIFLTTITIFFNKTYFINKNILEITTKFILSNQTKFLKKLNNIIQVFNKTISQQKQKPHSITHNKIEPKIHVG